MWTGLLFVLAVCGLVPFRAVDGLLAVKVVGNRIVNASSGEPIILRGAANSGGEFMCVHDDGTTIFNVPTNVSFDSVGKTMKSWGMNLLRLPMNEDCWLGINGVNKTKSGANYRNAFKEYVSAVTALDMVVLLDLHWTAAGSEIPVGQDIMPNIDHSLDFWTDVANTFKDNPAVMFDVFNEPHPDTWTCWKNGTNCTSAKYQVAGFEQLVGAIRDTGSTNIVLLGGLRWSNWLSRWDDFGPDDPAGQMAVGWHSYEFNDCNFEDCWEFFVRYLTVQYPLVLGEFGHDKADDAWLTKLMNWCDCRNISYSAWTFNDWNNGEGLLTSWDGFVPSAWGSLYKSHLATADSHPCEDPIPPVPARGCCVYTGGKTDPCADPVCFTNYDDYWGVPWQCKQAGTWATWCEFS